MTRKFRYDPATDEVLEVGAPPKTNGILPPKHCEALGFTHPEEIPLAKELDRQLGLGDVEYDSDLRPVFTSTRDYDRYVKAHGYVNRSSCGNRLRLTASDLDLAAQRVGGEAGSWRKS